MSMYASGSTHPILAASESTNEGDPELEAIKSRQRDMWASGDFAVVGTTLQIVGETLCESADVRARERVLDVACGNGNASLAAARRFATTTGLDYVPSLLRGASARARAEGLELRLVEGDAEAMPFADESFEVVLSTFGVMFAPDHARAARELARVCRRGGRIALASWTPDGFIGRLLQLVGRYVPPPPRVSSPARWGDDAYVRALFSDAGGYRFERRSFMFRYASPLHFVEIFRKFYGPTHRAFAALDDAGRRDLTADMIDLLARANVAGSSSLVVPGEYLEAIVSR